MSTFSKRNDAGQSHESAVAERLRAAGWTVHPFGQALFPDDLKEVLRRFDTPLRHFPDLVAYRWERARLRFYGIDGKTGRSDTPNYCVEARSVSAALFVIGVCRLPVLYVTADFHVLHPQHIDLHGRLVADGKNNGSGSGTPYYLISKRHAKPFDDVFGVPAS